MYYTVYKTTNLINGRYYIGKHKTENLQDDYLGSGKLIIQAIEKYGKENFKKEILFVFNNENEMNFKEKELVIISESTYNLCEGGQGGFSYINNNDIPKFKGKKHTEETKRKISEFRKGKPTNLGKIPWNKGRINVYSEDHLNKLRKPRSEETKRKISETLKKRGRNSEVECCPSKSEVVGSNPIVRSTSNNSK